MKIWLLTHSEELKKPSGTGKIVKETIESECEIIVWSRVDPSTAILALTPANTILVYPCKNEQQTSLTDLTPTVDNIIIIDGTWQQAKKMYNQSPYLKAFAHYEIKGIKSLYQKRRNQKDIGLCTAEVAIHLLTEYKHPAASSLLEKFTEFNQ